MTEDMDFSNDLRALENDFEAALTGLIKLIKAFSFYPADHPALVSAVKEACSDFQPLLKKHSARTYYITKEGFCLDAALLAPKNNSLRKFALKLVERRIRNLQFLPDLANYELLMLAEELAKPAAQMLAEGGLARRLADRQIKSISINGTNLDAIHDKQPNPETQLPPAATAASGDALATVVAMPPRQTDTDQLRETLELLKEPQDDQTYQQLLNEIQQFSHSFFSKVGIPGYLAVLNLLESHRKDSTRTAMQQQATETLIGQLLTEMTCKTLVDAIADQKLKPSQHRALIRLMVSLGSKIAPQLLKRLYAERDAIIRRHYSDILAHMGESIFDLLRNDLKTDTWHLVRNVVTILGKTRLESALPLLTQVIEHPDVRVRRAVIRALGAIGGSPVIPLLLRLGQDTDAELHHPAIMTLGSLKNPRAIPPLVDILKKSDPLGKQTDLKSEVIRALTATESPQAIIPLLQLARRINPLNRKHIEALRAEAIIALGQLGNSQLIPILEHLPRREKAPVSRALKQATMQLRKQQHIT